MKFTEILKLSLASFILFLGFAGSSQETQIVGGAEMFSNKNIIENVVNSNDHTILVKAIGAAELSATLKDEGPFTVFAPTNEAFKKLPESSLMALLKPENKLELTQILSYHVVAGNYSATKLMAMAKGKDMAKLKTLSGTSLVVAIENGQLFLKDAAGNKSKISIADVNQSNGVVHVITSVLMPSM